MSEDKKYVYIDAPSLDNTDRCKFIIDEEFQYILTGNSNDVAEIPLYDKLQGKSSFFMSLSSPGISRTNIKEGRVNTTDDTLGGDYSNGNVCQVYSKIFKTGRVSKLIFKFFEIPTEGDIIPLVDYNTIPKVAIFANQFKEDGTTNVGVYDFVTYATFTGDKTSEGFGIYEVDDKFTVSGKMCTSPLYTFCFVFLNKNSLESSTPLTGVTQNSLRSTYCSRVMPGLRMVPRGSIDNISYVCYSPNANSRTDGEARILDFDFYEDVDLIDEYIGANSSNHHLDSSEFRDLNDLRYTAPAFIANNTYTKLIGATGWTSDKDQRLEGKSYIKISDNTLSRNGKFNLNGKMVFAIKIPLQPSNDNNKFISNAIKGGFSNTSSGLFHTNRRVMVALDTDAEGNPKDWVYSDDYLQISYFSDYITYEMTFKNALNPELLRYKGKGIFIAACPALKSNGSFENGNYNLPFFCWKNSDGEYWSYTQGEDFAMINDYDLDSTSFPKTYMTPGIKVVFDYANRAEWFDYLESLVLENLPSN